MKSFKQILGVIGANAVTGKTTIHLTKVTPETAKILLENNAPNNRRLRRSVVAKYANDMRNGNWRAESSNMIVISSDGRVLDGQHRLQACVESGTTQVFYIMTGADDEMYEVMDSGCLRVAEDYLDVPNRRLVAYLAGVIFALIMGAGSFLNVLACRISRNVSSTRSDRLGMAREYNDVFQGYIADARNMSRQTGNKYMTHIAAALLLIDQLHQGERLAEFVTDFQNICSGDPIIAICKEKLLTNQDRTDKIDQRTYNVDMVLTAYELYRSNSQDKPERILRQAFANYTQTQSTYEKLIDENRRIRWAKADTAA